MSSPDCKVELRVDGTVEFNEAFSDVKSLTRGGTFKLDVTEGGVRRELDLRERNGSLVRVYRLEGREQTFDAAAQAWLADMLITLRNSTDKLQALLDRLGRYGAHGGEAPEPIAVEQVLAKVAARYEGQHDVVLVERPSCSVFADREGLEQALVHLVQNAIEASEAGTGVFLDFSEEQGHAVIEVIDSGPGMSPEFIRTRLFKPFYSSKPGGFGIGAFEARELIRAMGGRLDVESREGLGTRFRVRLPLAGAARFIRTIQSPRPEVA